MLPNIVITGFMGTGKSTVGPIVANLLGWLFYDLDTIISKREQKSISRIFSESGERYFRELETQMINELCRVEKAVIAVGGGALIRDGNLKMMSENGLIFCLTANPETIVKRLDGLHDRPLLEEADRLKRIIKMLREREIVYKKSSYKIDTSKLKPIEVAEKIKSILNSIEITRKGRHEY